MGSNPEGVGLMTHSTRMGKLFKGLSAKKRVQYSKGLDFRFCVVECHISVYPPSPLIFVNDRPFLLVLSLHRQNHINHQDFEFRIGIW